MLNLLVIETSPRGDASVSRAMTAHYIDAWLQAHPGGTVVRRDLTNTALKFTDAAWLAAYFTPSERQSRQMHEALALSDELVGELVRADAIVIGTPVYNYNVPAILKSWFDHIVRKGITVSVAGEGMLQGKSCSVMLASGGVYTQGSPIRERDIATLWLRLMLNVLGIDNVDFVAAGGTKAIDLGQQSRSDYMAPILPLIRDAARR